MSKYKDRIIENCPKRWGLTKLGDLDCFYLETGGTPSTEKNEYWGGDIPWLSSGEVHKKTINETEGFITQEGYNNSNARLLPVNSVLVALAGQGKTRGKVAITNIELTTNQSVAAIITNERQFNSLFLYYFLENEYEELRGESYGAGRAGLSLAILAKYRILKPSRFEQDAIVRVLKAIDDLIKNTQSLIIKYQQIKAGLMHDLFTRGLTADGKLRPPREQAPELYQETPIGWIPKEWRCVPISNLCSHIIDCPHSTPNYQDSGIPCIRTADMLPGQLLIEQAYRISEADYVDRIQRLKPQVGDVIYSREGERLGIASPVGKDKVCMAQRVMMLRPDKKVDHDFLLWSMNLTSFYRRVLRGLGATTSPHVNVGDIKKILTYCPPENEQAKIGKALKTIHSRIVGEKQFKEKLKSLKSGLMHDLLTGKVQVKIDQMEITHG